MPELISLERRKTSPLHVIMLFLLLAGIRLFLPTLFNDSMSFFSATRWAVVEQQNWGKQVLAGVMEYSPLPSALMIILSPLGLIPSLPFNESSVLLAVTQASVFCIFYVLMGEFCRRHWLRGILAAVAFLAVGMGVNGWIPGYYVLKADPYWTLLIPLGLILLFGARIGRIASLRPVLGFSLACGVMVFAGPAGIILGGAALFVLLVFGRDELKAEGGTTLLALMPFIYGVILHLLFNLVIMGDLFFSIRRLIPYFLGDGGSALFTSWRIACVFVWGMVALGTLFVINSVPFFVRLAWGLSIACIPIFLVRRCAALTIGGEYLFHGMVIVSLVIAMVVLVTTRGLTLRHGIPSIAFCLVFILSVSVVRRYSSVHESYFDNVRPSRDDITSHIDTDWKGSRVLVFGARAATVYCMVESDDPTIRERFIGNVDFNMNVVAERIEKEQLHLLVPPDNGLYYPRGDNFFSNLYRNEEPNWLHLERVWNGWQLWRCVRKRPQKGSSLAPTHRQSRD